MEYGGGATKASRIVVRDDDQDITARLTTILRSQGLMVYQTRDSRKELRNADELQPDLILADMRTPGIDTLGRMHSSARIDGISDSDPQVTMIHT